MVSAAFSFSYSVYLNMVGSQLILVTTRLFSEDFYVSCAYSLCFISLPHLRRILPRLPGQIGRPQKSSLIAQPGLTDFNVGITGHYIMMNG